MSLESQRLNALFMQDIPVLPPPPLCLFANAEHDQPASVWTYSKMYGVKPFCQGCYGDGVLAGHEIDLICLITSDPDSWRRPTVFVP